MYFRLEPGDLLVPSPGVGKARKRRISRKSSGPLLRLTAWCRAPGFQGLPLWGNSSIHQVHVWKGSRYSLVFWIKDSLQVGDAPIQIERFFAVCLQLGRPFGTGRLHGMTRLPKGAERSWGLSESGGL